MLELSLKFPVPHPLPVASGHALPESHRRLMTEPDSPIKDFYPVEFEIDLNGKRRMWEAVVLLPFIDEKRLLGAIRHLDHTLTPDERRRNSVGCHMLFVNQRHPAASQLVELEPNDAPIPVAAMVPQVAAGAATAAADSEREANALSAERLRAELEGDAEAVAAIDAKLAQLREPANGEVIVGQCGLLCPQPPFFLYRLSRSTGGAGAQTPSCWLRGAGPKNGWDARLCALHGPQRAGRQSVSRTGFSRPEHKSPAAADRVFELCGGGGVFCAAVP